MDDKSKLSHVTIFLHWIIAIAILLLCAVGLYMVSTETWALYDWHKSFGLIVFPVILARIAWRMKNGLPQPVRPFSSFEHMASKAAHVLLLTGTLAMPLTGMLFSGASGHGFGVFGVEIFPSRYDAGGKAIPFSPSLADGAQALHGYIGYLLLILVALHVAAAFKHHFIDRDSTLKRMLTGGGQA